jgi:iron complex transport system substrate-binding protein
MPTSPLSRLRFVRLPALLLAAAVALVGCGPQDAGGATDTATEAGGSDSFPRVVQHELGETTIPERPERVVAVTDGGELASLLALGVEPVGFGKRNDPIRPWIEAAGGAEIESYDLAGTEVSFERIAAWKPDLLVVQAGFATKENLAQYSALAPTVVTSFIDWKDNLRQVSEATGTTEKAAELVAENEAAVEDAAEALAGSKGLKVQAITVFEGPEIYRLNDASPLGKLAPSLGLAPFPKAGTPGEAVDTVSLEKLADIDADVLLIQDFGDDGAYRALKEQEIWKRIPAVKAGKVIELSVEESEASYFDSVLTVPLNLQMLQDRLG